MLSGGRWSLRRVSPRWSVRTTEDEVRRRIVEALAGRRTPEGGYRLSNEFHYLIARASCGDRAGQLLEQEDERLVALAGGAAETDLAGAVAGEVGVEVAAGELCRLRGGRRRGQLWVRDPAVAGEAAAGRRGGDEDVIGERACKGAAAGRGPSGVWRRWDGRSPSRPCGRPRARGGAGRVPR